MDELRKRLSSLEKSLPQPPATQLKIDVGTSAIAAATAPLKRYASLSVPFSGTRAFTPLMPPHVSSILTAYPFKSIEQTLVLPAPIRGVTTALDASARINFDFLRVVRNPLDIVSELTAFIRTLERLNASSLSHFRDIRFPVMNRPAVAMAHLAREGWVLDPLLLIAGDDMLRFLESAPEDRTRSEVAAALQSIISAHRQEFLGIVTSHLEFLLADTPKVIQSHLTAFMVALDTLVSGRDPALIAQSMIARTESIFNRAYLSRGWSSREAKGLLYSTRNDKIEARETMLADALKRAIANREANPDPTEAEVPYWQTAAWSHERLEMAITAFSQKHSEDDDLPFEVEGARNHAQHDGVGTEALDWAVRSVLWFAGIAVVLGSILEPLSQSDAELGSTSDQLDLLPANQSTSTAG